MRFYLPLFLLVLISLVACSSKSTKSQSSGTPSSDRRVDLEQKYKDKIGLSKKQDFVEEFGNPDWCRQEPTGEETCRFFRKKATQWIGEEPDRKSYVTFDEVLTHFDNKGFLKSFEVKAQK